MTAHEPMTVHMGMEVWTIVEHRPVTRGALSGWTRVVLCGPGGMTSRTRYTTERVDHWMLSCELFTKAEAMTDRNAQARREVGPA